VAPGKSQGFKPLDTNDVEDPIGQAFHARATLGGPSDKFSVIKETDARKIGVQLVKTFKLRDLKGPDLLELVSQQAPKKESKPNATRTAPASKPEESKIVKPLEVKSVKPAESKVIKSTKPAEVKPKPAEEKKQVKTTKTEDSKQAIPSKYTQNYPGLSGDLSQDPIG